MATNGERTNGNRNVRMVTRIEWGMNFGEIYGIAQRGEIGCERVNGEVMLCEACRQWQKRGGNPRGKPERKSPKRKAGRKRKREEESAEWVQRQTANVLSYYFLYFAKKHECVVSRRVWKNCMVYGDPGGRCVQAYAESADVWTRDMQRKKEERGSVCHGEKCRHSECTSEAEWYEVKWEAGWNPYVAWTKKENL